MKLVPQVGLSNTKKQTRTGLSSPNHIELKKEEEKRKIGYKTCNKTRREPTNDEETNKVRKDNNIQEEQIKTKIKEKRKRENLMKGTKTELEMTKGKKSNKTGLNEFQDFL